MMDLTPLLACPMCMSGAEDGTKLAANIAVGVLGVFLMTVLVAFGFFISYIARRSKQLELEESLEGAAPSGWATAGSSSH